MADLATAYIQLVPSLKGAQKTIEGELAGISGERAGGAIGDSMGEGLIGKLGGIASKAAQVLAGAFAAKKVFDFGKAAFDAYADFEQLSGGAEKIFDKIDQSKILDDANSAWKNLNMSANEYLASINQTGAMFAQTMGDEKGYETAKLGMQAISDYATGTGRDINELNGKFSAITRSTGSYQSIADQFAGILPATSKDFLEQAKAAGILSDSYEQLTDVPVAEYQEAVTKMLEKGVKDLGLEGNTAREALGTLSGSMLATKSAWQNLVTEFGKPDADIGARIGEMFTALMGENGEGGMLRNVVGEVGTIARNMIGAVSQGVQTGFGWLLANGPQLFSNLMNDISAQMPVIQAKVSEIMTTVGQWLVANAPALIGQAAQLLMTFAEWLTGNGPVIVDKVAGIFNLAWQWLVANGPTILQTIGQILSNVLAAIVQHGPQVLANIATTIGSIIGYIGSAATEMIPAAIEFMGGLITGTSEKGAELHEWFAGLPQRLLDALGDVGSFLVDAGRQIIDGFWTGLKSKWDDVTGWVGGLGDWIAQNKGPKSYDLALLVPNGQWIMTGLSEGIESGIPQLQRTLAGVTGSMQAAVSATYGAQAPAQRPAAPVGTGWSEVASAIGGLRGDMGSLGVYLDGNKLVGGISTRMDRALVMI